MTGDYLSDFDFTLEEAWLMWSHVDFADASSPLAADQWFECIRYKEPEHPLFAVDLAHMTTSQFLSRMEALVTRGHVHCVVSGSGEVSTLPSPPPDLSSIRFWIDESTVEQLQDFFTRRAVAIVSQVSGRELIVPTFRPLDVDPFPGIDYVDSLDLARLTWYSSAGITPSGQTATGLRLLVEQGPALGERDTGGFVLPGPDATSSRRSHQIAETLVSLVEYHIVPTWAVLAVEWVSRGIQYRVSDVWSMPASSSVEITDEMRNEVLQIATSLIEHLALSH